MTLDIEYFKSNTQLLHDAIIKRLELYIMDKDLKKFYDRYLAENKEEDISFDLWLFHALSEEEVNSILGDHKKDYINK